MGMWKLVKAMKVKQQTAPEERKSKKKKLSLSSALVNLTGAKMSISDVHYDFVLNKKNVGRTMRFFDEPARILGELVPDEGLREKFLRRGALDYGTQATPFICNSQINTIRATYTDTSVCHTEGGWPKDVSVSDEENVNRWRKKLEKDDNFLASVPALAEEVETCIKFNNAINVYEDYWSTSKCVYQMRTKPQARIVESFGSPTGLIESVRNISWSPHEPSRMGIAYCSHEFNMDFRNTPSEAYVWDLQQPYQPLESYKASNKILEISHHPKNIHAVIGALFNGQVCLWDTRASSRVRSISDLRISHGDCCINTIWTNSKGGNEFFSLGMDGQVIWWDERNLNEQLDQLWLDPERGSNCKKNAIPGSTLEYDPTLPTKFLAGNEQGQVMVFMRKGKTANDRLQHTYEAHLGHVRSIHRNPMFIKNFLTIGDHTVKIWAEDCKHSSILWTAPKAHMYTAGNWVPTRASSYCACRTDGYLDIWDLLVQPVSSLLSIKVFNDSCSYLSPSHNGKFVAVGSKHGVVRLVNLDGSLTQFDKSDKPKLAHALEREAKRERLVDLKEKELRMKCKPSQQCRRQSKQSNELLAADHENSPEETTAALLIEDEQLVPKLFLDANGQDEAIEMEMPKNPSGVSYCEHKDGKTIFHELNTSKAYLVRMTYEFFQDVENEMGGIVVDNLIQDFGSARPVPDLELLETDMTVRPDPEGTENVHETSG